MAIKLTDKRPLILSLLIVDKKFTSSLPEILSRDVYEQNSTVFKHDGLFSTSIFGEVGSSERMLKFSYININLKVFHPRVYRELCKLSSLYKGIMDGTKYAVFDDKIKNFVLSNEQDGHTGYTFFLKHFNNINFDRKDNGDARTFKIEFIEKFSLNELLIDKYLVLPAGLRDYTVTESGKVLENEINGLYRKLLTVSYSAKIFKNDLQDDEIINKVKVRLQRVTSSIYEYIENILDGKGGYFQDKFTKVSVIYGTRNVITASGDIVKDANDKSYPGGLTSTTGTFQVIKGLYPIITYILRTNYLHDVFDTESLRSRLINMKTFKREIVELDEKTRSKWVTDDGIEKIINKLKYDNNKNKPIIIKNHYLFIKYTVDDKIVIVNDIDKIPDDIDKSLIEPLTYGELFYIIGASIVHKYPAYITRYPITGLGSIVPTYVYIKSTINTKRMQVKILDNPDFITMNEYPIKNSKWFNSLTIPMIYLERLGADFDGDVN